MNRQLLKDLADMTKNEVISEETAERIRIYYHNKQPEAQKQLFVIFGILGAILVGLGLILIIAHNWETMPRWTQTLLALLPMFAGQGLCLYVLLKREDSMAWREGTAAFLFLSVGACIALVGQIYNIPGTVTSYLLSWMLLVFPLMYIMQASIGSILYIIIISYFGQMARFDPETSGWDYYYWGLLALALPYYYLLYKRKPGGSFMIFHHWLLPLSVMLMLGYLLRDSHSDWKMLFPLYASLYGFYYHFGHLPFAKGANSYLVFGSLGGIVMLIIGSFHGFWEAFYVRSEQFFLPGLGLFALIVLTLGAIGILIWRYKRDPNLGFDPFNFAFLAFMLICLLALGAGPLLPSILCNILVAAIGILTIREGAKTENLGVLNYGLLIISILIGCRYFDLNISFVIRGLLFIAVGVSFFLANYMTIKKKKLGS